MFYQNHENTTFKRTFETMQDIYSDNYGIKVYTGNCIIQLNVNPKDPSESFLTYMIEMR